MNKEEKVAKGMEEIAAILNRHSLQWYLSCGALLGIYRDGKTIPWDKDVDIELKAESFFPVIDKVAKDLKKADFRVITRYRDGDARLVCIKYKFWFVLRPFKLEGNYRIMGKDRKIPPEFFDELSTITYKGIDYPCPKNIEGYFEFMYGKNWRIPLKVSKSVDCITNTYHRQGKVKS